MTFNGFGTQTAWPDGTCFASKDREISKGRTYIRDLSQGMNSFNIVGLVVAKQGVHSFPDRKNPGTEKCHFFFTLRDTPTDFINVNCWGNERFIYDLANSFKINDVVEVRNPQIQNKQSNEAEQRWRPWTSSPYQLHVSETYSSVSLFSGWDMSEFDKISHVPFKASNDFYTLGDIIANDQNLHGEHVNIQAVVKSIGVPRDIVTKTGKRVKRCEVVLFDETCYSFPLIMWDEDTIEMSQTWVPKDINVKVTFDDFKKSMIATCDNKTIITANPDTMEARYLYNYAQSLELLDDDPLNNPEASLEGYNLENVKNVYSVQQLKQIMAELDNSTQQIPTFGIVYACLTSFDIDSDVKQVIASRCVSCNQRVALLSETCMNPECPVSSNPTASGSSTTQQTIKTQYEIMVSLSDHTGTVENCRLAENCAETMCGCKAVDFARWTIPQLTNLKLQFLLERCKVYFKLTISSSNRSTSATKKWIRLLSCTLVDPKEAVESLS